MYSTCILCQNFCFLSIYNNKLINKHIYLYIDPSCHADLEKKNNLPKLPIFSYTLLIFFAFVVGNPIYLSIA